MIEEQEMAEGTMLVSRSSNSGLSVFVSQIFLSRNFDVQKTNGCSKEI
jgi:hypothetical protein